MQTITLHSHTGSDGILHLNVPVDLVDTEFKVTVMLQPIISDSKSKTPEELGWTPGFFETTYGAWERVSSEAKAKGLIERVQPHLEALRQRAGFYVSESFYQSVLTLANEIEVEI
jgi:hypothetical protein